MLSEAIRNLQDISENLETTRKTEAYIGRWDQNGSWEEWLRGVEWSQVAQERDRWRAVVNAVTNLRVLTPRS
jgi:hypothetical protein